MTSSGKDRRGEAIEVGGVRLTSPERVLFPEQGVTKRQLAEHYLRWAERMLPHVAGRPLTLLRCPEGREKECFFQRHPGEGLPERMSRDIGEDDGPAIVVEEPADLVELVQRGTLEMHPRGARADRPERPDRIVFDLDPGEGVAFAEVKEAASLTRARLADLGLEAFLKTTGGKGLHVVVPIERRHDWPDVKAFARALAASIADERPDTYLIRMSKRERRGRVFIDYLRNDRKSSAIAPYSTRARAGAPFALPIAWDRLDALERPDPARVGESVPFADTDPWAGLDDVRQRLTKRMLEMAED